MGELSDAKKVYRVIESCETTEQLFTAASMVDNFRFMYGCGKVWSLLDQEVTKRIFGKMDAEKYKQRKETINA